MADKIYKFPDGKFEEVVIELINSHAPKVNEQFIKLHSQEACKEIVDETMRELKAYVRILVFAGSVIASILSYFTVRAINSLDSLNANVSELSTNVRVLQKTLQNTDDRVTETRHQIEKIQNKIYD